MLSLCLSEIAISLQTFPKCRTLHLSLLHKTSVLAIWFLLKHLRSLSSSPVAYYANVAYPLGASLHGCPVTLHRSSASGVVGVGVGGWGDAVGFLRHCVTVISGGTGGAWRSRPWILVTGCWWSLPTFLETRHSGTYSQRCRSRSWEARQPSADRQRR